VADDQVKRAVGLEAKASNPMTVNHLKNLRELNLLLGAILAVYGEVKPGFIHDPNLPCSNLRRFRPEIFKRDHPEITPCASSSAESKSLAAVSDAA
jgi:hypothetical protein